MNRLNPYVQVNVVREAFCPANALALAEAHDVILDCTDRVMTRYLVSDAGVLARKPIVSGAAQGYEGQLVVLHRDLGDGQRGPCYRCLFPQSPRPEHTQSCDDGGVLGCVTGIVGTWQALETVKVLTGLGERIPSMLFLTPLSLPAVRSVRVRARQARTCRVCGDSDVRGKLTRLEEEDYASFCGLDALDAQDDSVPSVDADALQRNDVHVVDVRSAQEYGITALRGSMHMALETIQRDTSRARLAVREAAQGRDVLVVCRRGNDSRTAVRLLAMPECKNVRGGLRRYAAMHPEFPMY